MKSARYEIDVTYRCNLRCLDCNRLVGVLPWSDTDITTQDVIESGKRIKAAKIKMGLVKVCGGEPMVHPNIREITEVILREWNPIRIWIMTNGTHQEFSLSGVKFRHSRPKSKNHTPFLVSPADLGIGYNGAGVLFSCMPQKLCGRSFDHYGFSFCPFAGVIGRLVGMDPYSSVPIAEGREEICSHCIYSLSPTVRIKLERKARQGVIHYPTPTFATGISAPSEFPVFQIR